jgi:hypothetical protein
MTNRHRARAASNRAPAARVRVQVPFARSTVLPFTTPDIRKTKAFALLLFASDAPVSGLSWCQHLQPGSTADRYPLLPTLPRTNFGFQPELNRLISNVWSCAHIVLQQMTCSVCA